MANAGESIVLCEYCDDRSVSTAIRGTKSGSHAGIWSLNFKAICLQFCHELLSCFMLLVPYLGIFVHPIAQRSQLRRNFVHCQKYLFFANHLFPPLCPTRALYQD